ncbi:MAG: MATE family efflux transporter [Lachnospiraceae bacterium]
MNMKKKVNILEDKLDSVIWIIIIPIIATNLIDGIYGIIDSLFVANIGSMAVASVTFVGPIQDTLSAVGTGLAFAGCGLIAQYIGAGDEKRARRMIGHVFVIGTIVGFVVSAFTFFFSEFVLIRAGITDALIADAKLYLELTSWSVCFNFIIIIYLAIERAQGNTKHAMTINFYSLALKLVFCYLFTILYDGGIAGIGYATVLAKGICAVICIFCMISKKNDRLLKLEEYAITASHTKILLITAIPLIMEKSLVAYGFVITNKYVLEFGEAVLAAYGVTNKVNSVFFKSVTAFGYGLAVIVGQNVGAKNIDRARAAVRKTMLYSVLVAILALAFLIPMRPYIASLFIDSSEETYQHIINAMGIYTASIIPWGITECVLGIFQGTGYTMYNLTISLVRIYVLRVPVVIILSQPFWGLGEFGIWYAMLISNTLCAFFSLSMYFLLRKKVFNHLFISKVSKE